MRMSNKRLPKQVLISQLSQGHRTHGGQRKRCKDTLKAWLKKFGINTATWEDHAGNRSSWGQLLCRGTDNFESNHLAQAAPKQQMRKERELERQLYQPLTSSRQLKPVIPACESCGSRIDESRQATSPSTVTNKTLCFPVENIFFNIEGSPITRISIVSTNVYDQCRSV